MSLTPGQAPALAATDLVVHLAGSPVLRGVTAMVRPGEAVALVGGNGSGKTTLVRAALGLVAHQGGTVQLFGKTLSRFGAWHRIGYVPQRSTGALAGAKVREVVASGRLAHRRPFWPARAEDRRAVSTALEAVGLTDRAGQEVAHLSGGQQQRILIARALAGNPDLLVLDEPTAGVDLEHQETLAQLLSGRLAAGLAVLVVLHEAGALAPLIDRVVRLQDGCEVLPETAGNGQHHGHGHSGEPGSAPPAGLVEPDLEGRRGR